MSAVPYMSGFVFRFAVFFLSLFQCQATIHDYSNGMDYHILPLRKLFNVNERKPWFGQIIAAIAHLEPLAGTVDQCRTSWTEQSHTQDFLQVSPLKMVANLKLKNPFYKYV
jgi:hypothetical protein